MRQQFFYTRREQIGGTDDAPIYKEYKDSFNVNAVIRSLTMADGSVLVLLNDIHERTTEQPNINPINNKMKGVIRRRDVYQSEIYMSPADGERFYRECSIIDLGHNVGPIHFNMKVVDDLTKEDES